MNRCTSEARALKKLKKAYNVWARYLIYYIQKSVMPYLWLYFYVQGLSHWTASRVVMTKMFHAKTVPASFVLEKSSLKRYLSVWIEHFLTRQNKILYFPINIIIWLKLETRTNEKCWLINNYLFMFGSNYNFYFTDCTLWWMQQRFPHDLSVASFNASTWRGLVLSILQTRP